MTSDTGLPQPHPPAGIDPDELARMPIAERARVAATTSSGTSGAGACRSQPVLAAQSRRYCLSNEGCDPPGTQVSSGQKRDESGVSTSSPR